MEKQSGGKVFNKIICWKSCFSFLSRNEYKMWGAVGRRSETRAFLIPVSILFTVPSPVRYIYIQKVINKCEGSSFPCGEWVASILPNTISSLIYPYNFPDLPWLHQQRRLPVRNYLLICGRMSWVDFWLREGGIR